MPDAPRKLSHYFAHSKRKGRAGLPLMSVTMRDGLMERAELEKGKERKTISALSPEEHLTVSENDLAYNMMRMWQGAFGIAGQDANVSPAYVVMTPKPTVCVEFASQWFRSEIGLYALWAYSHGLTSDRLRLYPNDFLHIPVHWPELTRQEEIGRKLSEWDRARDVLKSLVRTYEQRLEWTVREVLTGKRRLYGFDSPWVRRPLASILTEHKLKPSGRERVHSVTVKWGLVDQVEHLGRSFAADDTSNYNRVCPGDIVYTKSPTGKFPFGIVRQSELDHDAIVSPLYGVFRPASTEEGVFLSGLFSSPNFTNRYLTPLVQKGAKNTIAVTNSQFLEGRVEMPSEREELVELVGLIEAAQENLTAASLALREVERQKKALSQHLFRPGGPR